jgi:hypothetical protein
MLGFERQGALMRLACIRLATTARQDFCILGKKIFSIHENPPDIG